MPWPEIAKMLVLGVSAGILSGMFGIGGGLVIVPVLILLFGFDPKTAVGTSLFALLLPTGLLGVLEYWRRGEMKPRARVADRGGALLRGLLRRPPHRLDVGLDHEAGLRGLPDRGGDLLPLDELTGAEDGARRRERRAEAEACRPGPELSARPLTARVVLVNRPDEAVRVAQGKLPPAPGLVGRLAGDAQNGSFVQAVLVERVDVRHLDLEVNADAQPGVVELVGVRLLGMDHEREIAQPQDRQAVRCSFLLGMNLQTSAPTTSL